MRREIRQGKDAMQVLTRICMPPSLLLTLLLVDNCRGHLLDVRGKLGQSLAVGQDGAGCIAQEADVPDAGQAQPDRDVLFKLCSSEVLVHIVCTCIRCKDVFEPALCSLQKLLAYVSEANTAPGPQDCISQLPKCRTPGTYFPNNHIAWPQSHICLQETSHRMSRQVSWPQ